MIKTVLEQSTHLVYKIEDGTAIIDVRMWIDSDDNEGKVQKRAALREGVYVRVYGMIVNEVFLGKS